MWVYERKYQQQKVVVIIHVSKILNNECNFVSIILNRSVGQLAPVLLSLVSLTGSEADKVKQEESCLILFN